MAQSRVLRTRQSLKQAAGALRKASQAAAVLADVESADIFGTYELGPGEQPNGQLDELLELARAEHFNQRLQVIVIATAEEAKEENDGHSDRVQR